MRICRNAFAEEYLQKNIRKKYSQKIFAEKHRDAFRNIFTPAFEELLKAPYLQNASESVKRSALTFFGINTILSALNRLGSEIYTDMPFSEFPLRPDGGKWYVLGGIIPDQPYEYGKYRFSGKTFLSPGLSAQKDLCVNQTLSEERLRYQVRDSGSFLSLT